MAIRQLKDGRFQIDVYSKAGKRIRHIYSCTMEKAIEIEAATLMHLGRTKTNIPTFDKFKPQYLEFCERQRGYKYKRNVVNLLSNNFGQLRLNQIQTYNLEKYQSKMLIDGISPATINRRIATIKHMMTKACDWGIVDDIALRAVRKVKMLKEDNGRMRFLTRAEADKLVEECGSGKSGSYLTPIVQVALNTGMRLGEILKLRWEHVDLANNMLTVVSSNAKNARRRDIPINATLQSVFKSMARPISGGFVFGKDGKQRTDIRVGMNNALRRCKIRDFHFHDLRHTFASWLVQSGVDLTTLQKLLGHRSYSMTLRYAHLAPEHLASAVRVLDIKNDVVNVVNGKSE